MVNKSGGNTMNSMTHKGYFAKISFDERDNIFWGKVVGIKDSITFEGETVNELRTAFVDSVEDYLNFCKKRGEEPDKPYSGKFLVRVEPELHKTLVVQARKDGKSLNTLVQDALLKAVKNSNQQVIQD